jgi:hypothetical protein
LKAKELWGAGVGFNFAVSVLHTFMITFGTLE